MLDVKTINEHIAVVKDLNIVENTNIIYAYLAGSIMEGFGNDSSDIDVFVICKNLDELKLLKQVPSETILEVGDTIVRNITVDSIRYDFEYYTIENFESTVRKINKLNFNTDKHIEILSNNSIDLIHRLKFANPIVNIEEFNEFKKNIKFKNLNKYLVVKIMEKYDGYLEDLEGALSSKDWGTAYTLIKLILKTGMNAYLASYGETNPGEKWIYRKLLRFAENNNDKDIIKEYFAFEGVLFNEDSIRSYAKSVLNFNQKLILQAQIILK